MRNRRLKSLVTAALMLTAALFWTPAGAQSPQPAPVSTYLTTWPAFQRPYDLAHNPEDGTLAVLSPGFGSIEILDSGGTRLELRKGFKNPRSAAFLPGGALLVGEADTGSVKAYAPGGGVLFALGSGNGEFQSPNDIAVHGQTGRIYVVDSPANLVKTYRQADGAPEIQFGSFGTGPGQFRFPISIAVSENLNEVYVGDSRNRRIVVFDAFNGLFKRLVAVGGDGDGEISYVGGLFVDSYNRLFVAETLGGFVQVLDSDGGFITKIGAHGNAAGQLRNPKAILLDSYNRLIVTSFYDRRLEVWGIDAFKDPSDPGLGGSAEPFPGRLQPNRPYLEVYFRLKGVDPAKVDRSSLRLQGVVAPEAGVQRMGPRLSLRFETSQVLGTLPPGTLGLVDFTLTGALLDGRKFSTDFEIVIAPVPVIPVLSKGGKP